MEEYMKLKILIVDDRYENLLSLSKYLQKFDFSVVTAISGKEAIKKVEAEEFGLFLLDVQMPEMDGFELAGLLKSNDKTKEVPIIFLTAASDHKEFEVTGLQTGAVDFVPKPFDIVTLMLKIRNNLRYSYNLKMIVKTNEELVKTNMLLEKSINYSNELYAMLSKEKQLSDDLLLNILPGDVANELKQKGKAETKYFNNVTVMFTDFVAFTKAAEKFSPHELVNELDTCFKAFDTIISKYQIEKIKTIGDAYMVVSGLPIPNSHHAEDMINAAKDINKYMSNRRTQLGDKTFEIRLGMHSGSVVAGIVGKKKFAYDIWGDTVNIASRMEHGSEPGKINISHSTYELIKNRFHCSYRGEIEAKNKGNLSMYFVDN